MTAGRIELRGLHKSFGNIDIIRGVDLTIENGERHAMIGPNGAGKSTLFHLISGYLRPTSGTISFAGQEIEGRAPWDIRSMGLSRCFQISSYFSSLSVRENLMCALLPHTTRAYSFLRPLKADAAVAAETDRLLDLLDMRRDADTHAGSLPYASQRFLEIGLAMAGDPGALLLDEPTAGMSRSETAQAMDLIHRISVGRTLLVIEHDMDVVFRLADRISVLVYGKVICTGSPAEVRADAAVQQAYLGKAHA